jgi:predicted transcriptional regulator
MARVALGWGVRELAEKAEVSPDTIARLERGEQTLRSATVHVIRRTLEQAGMLFIDEDDEAGVGVRLKRKSGRSRRTKSE